VEVKTLKEIKANTYDTNTGMIQIFLGVSFLLVAITTLGIVGLTSFSVIQRTRQIGTRRALGATRSAIVRYFLVETWIITGFGLAMGLILSYGLNYLLAGIADASRLEWRLLAVGMLLFWGMGLVAALLPALRGTTVSPVVATQTV
jgi:putative ABC transport system permease protein